MHTLNMHLCAQALLEDAPQPSAVWIYILFFSILLLLFINHKYS